MKKAFLVAVLVASTVLVSACVRRDAVTGTGYYQPRSSADVRSRADSLVSDVAKCRFGGTPVLREAHDLDQNTWGSTNNEFEESRYIAEDDYRNDCTKVVGAPQ